MLEELKETVCELNRRLPAEGVVVMTSGNVSGRDPATGHVVIKPSGVPFEKLRAQDMVVVDIDGSVMEGELKPSVDSRTHLHIYRNREDVFGVVHTHSSYATAFAANRRPIPVILTAHADEFGREIPVGDFCLIGEEEIGREVLRSIGASKAIIMANHGVFAIGKNAPAAFKSAVMAEDIAKTTFLAMQLGDPSPIGPEDIKKLHDRYTGKYGQ